jgi:hypothetical protein
VSATTGGARRPTAIPATIVVGVAADADVLPVRVTAGHTDRGPRFGDDVWDLRAFLPRTANQARVDFTTLADPIAVTTAKEYLYSRLHRGVPTSYFSGPSTHPMKITGLVGEFVRLRIVLAALSAAGASRLAQVTTVHLQAVLATWTDRPELARQLVGVLKALAAHGGFLSLDRLAVQPWPGRTATSVAGRVVADENLTERIPEHILGPLLKAAVFYVTTASRDVLAARGQITALRAARQDHPHGKGDAKRALEAFIAARRAAGRGIPATPSTRGDKRPGCPVVDGVMQAPALAMIGLLAGTSVPGRWQARLFVAGQELGYEEGGLDTPIAPWPDTGRPWRARLGMSELAVETTHLRTACWITVAYLSGMRDAEVRELGRDCAFSEPTDDGRTRHKLRGRVFKDRDLAGEQAEWVVLEIVHQAVEILLQLDDDPTHLFGFAIGTRYRLMGDVPEKLGQFRDHCNTLFSTPGALFIPHDIRPPDPQHAHPTDDAGQADADRVAPQGLPWAFNTRQLRRSLAWHIAHQPFGVVAGAKQYKHAAIALFEGYAGTSASGFAAEVAADETIARLDYLEDLYRDHQAGARSAGGAAAGIDAEFDRVARELGDVPGIVASPSRLRTMLEHLSTTLHPGALNDCFYRPEIALCARHATTTVNHPLPLLNTCSTCPNARRSSVHLPALALAADHARQTLDLARTRALSPLQHTALTDHVQRLDHLIAQINQPGRPA